MKAFRIFALFAFVFFVTACEKEEGYANQPELAGVSLKPGDGEKLYCLAPEFNITSGSLPAGYTPEFKAGNRIAVFDPVFDSVRVFYVSRPLGSTDMKALQALGVMSYNSFQTRAIFPASAVQEWKSRNSYTIAVPSEQVIGDGYLFDTGALVYASDLSSDKEELHFKSISSLAAFQVDTQGLDHVCFSFRNPGSESVSNYTVRKENGTFEVGKKYYVVVTPGEYDGLETVTGNTGTRHFRRNKVGGTYQFLAGNASYTLDATVKTPDVGFSIVSEYEIANMDTYSQGIPILNRLDANMKKIANTVLRSYFNESQRTRPVKAIRYEYESVGPDGVPVTLSSVVMFPQAVVSDSLPLQKIILANHFSFMKNTECPTLSNNVEGLLAWKDVAVVLPDYYGFGSSSRYCQAYLDPGMSARGSLDAFLAARKILSSKNIAVPETVYNIGYSQGGFNAVANLKYLSEDSGYDIDFDNTIAGGGPYDVLETFNNYIRESGTFGSVFPLVLVSITSFNELEHLGIDYSDIFKGKLLENYREWILSKDYDTSEVIDKLGTTKASDHLTENMTSLSGNIYNTFAEVGRKYSLTSGWTPKPGTRITLVHSEKDDMVPYSNHLSLVSFLKDNGCTPNVSILSSNHVTTYVMFLLLVIQAVQS